MPSPSTIRRVLKLIVPLLLILTAAHAERPIIIAHRGASGYLPEHTMESKTLAYEQGADYIEQDLESVTDVAKRFPDRARADGHFFVIDFTLAEIRTLLATERFRPATGNAVYPTRHPVWQGQFHLHTLEEELAHIAALNAKSGRRVGIHTEIKQPAFHRKEGHDISAIVIAQLRQHGYATKADPVFLQCFEWPEVQRLRQELGWQGKLIQLMSGRDTHSPARLAEIAQVADGIGPPLNLVCDRSMKCLSLCADAHAAGLHVHPYTVRIDELPKGCPSVDALHQLLFHEAKVDGLFTDFPDITLKALRP
jgi:glycerophosphoryl diester phosphodiesterase